MQFQPTTDHSLSTCDSCPRNIWIAQQQLDMVNSPLIRTKKLCLFCLDAATSVLKPQIREGDLFPEIRLSRQRTT